MGNDGDERGANERQDWVRKNMHENKTNRVIHFRISNFVLRPLSNERTHARIECKTQIIKHKLQAQHINYDKMKPNVR